ncbi:YncE family protein [Pseudomonas sp. Irchel s3h9]|uniref:YncE family protein n=1 Tax=Pseudomonas sp. Irchel s3h9 TaxID=2009192 RepID=UPI000BA31C60|nr:YncE family protein [Pseudomonas sp. Irchel s3h9]
MDVQSTEPVEALKLYPMSIPGWEDSVLPAGVAHGGIPQSIYPADKGLLMFIDPFTKLSTATGVYENAMAVGDNVTVWLNGEKTSASKTIEAGEESERISLRLESGLLVNGINEMFYRVTRLSGNPNDSEPILKLLYHNPAPGFPVPAGFTIAHPASVGPTEAAQGVVVSFKVSYARPYDKVTLTVGTERRTITVTDPAQPITLTLMAADFQQIGDNPQTPISARVVDQLGNSNLSATTFMDIHASESRYVVAFLNGPYSVAPGGRVKDIELSLTREGQGAAGAISVTLPAGTVFPDGIGGARDFTTQTDGTLTIRGVRGARTSGAYDLTAANGSAVATAALTIMAYGYLGSIFMPSGVTGITLSPDGTRAYTHGSSAVYVIDTGNSQVIGQTPIPQQASQWEIALNYDGSRAFACNHFGTVSVIDTGSSTLIANIPVGAQPIGIVMSQDGSRAFVSNWSGNVVTVIDTLDLRVTATIPVATYPRGIDRTPDDSLVLVVNYESYSVSVIDVQKLAVIRTVSTPMKPYGVAFSPDGNSFYVAGGVGGQGTVVQFNTHTWAPGKSIALNDIARGIVFNHAGTRAYVAAGPVYTIDTSNFEVITSTPVGALAMEIAISDDDSRAFVACDRGTVSVISLLPGVAGINAQNGEGETEFNALPWEPIPGDVR